MMERHVYANESNSSYIHFQSNFKENKDLIKVNDWIANENSVFPASNMSSFIFPRASVSNTTPLHPAFNFSMSEAQTIVDENTSGSYLEPRAKLIVIIAYILLIVLGTLENVVIAIVLIIKRQEKRTAANIYVINLTISDITLCLICMPFTLIKLTRINWQLGSLLCKLVPVLQCTNILVSTATIVTIAADRYLKIVRVGNSMRRPKYYNQISIACIWLVSLAFPLPLFKYYYVEPVMLHHFLLFKRCVEDWTSRNVQLTWTWTLIIIQYFIPILVLVFVHINIKNFLSKHQTNSLSAARKLQELKRNRRTTILLTMIAATFAVSWLPWHIVNILLDLHYLSNLKPENLYVILSFCHIMAMSTACTNPVLYGWLNTNLRNEILTTTTNLFSAVSMAVTL